MRGETLGEFDARALGIGEECDFQSSELRHFAVGHFQSEAVRLEFLAERFQVADFETDVIERTSFSRSLCLLRLAEIDLAAVEQGREEVTAGTRTSRRTS